MPALNFQKRFAELVETGQKNQTIRPLRKDGRDPKLDDKLYLYTGMRTKYCRKLGEGICMEIKQIILKENGQVIVGTESLDEFDKQRLAKDDGFGEWGWDKFWEFFSTKYKLPFNGLLIKWQNCKTFQCSNCKEYSNDPEDYTYSISELANPWETEDDFWICQECDLDYRN